MTEDVGLEEMARRCFDLYPSELRAWSAEQERVRAEKDAEIGRLRARLAELEVGAS